MQRYCHYCGRTTDYNFRCHICESNVEKTEEQFKDLYRKAMENGSAGTQYLVAECYAHGNGVERNALEAGKWYRKAAEQGDLEAMYCLALMEEKNDNEKECFSWIQKAAERGQADAQNILGNFYFFGINVEKNRETAVQWFRKAADQELATAIYNLADCYQNGYGIEKDDEKAHKLYLRAAERGDRIALNHLFLYYNEIYVDYDKAFKWCALTVARENPGEPYWNQDCGRDRYRELLKAMEKFDSRRKEYRGMKKQLDAAIRNASSQQTEEGKRFDGEIRNIERSIMEYETEYRNPLHEFIHAMEYQWKADGSSEHPIDLRFLKHDVEVIREIYQEELEALRNAKTEEEADLHREKVLGMREEYNQCSDRYEREKLMRNYGKALYRFGRFFYLGNAVDQDYEIADYWYRQAIRHGYVGPKYGSNHSSGISCVFSSDCD